MYLWIKAFHLIAVVCWFAALFYLPRLYVYHAQARDAGDHKAIEYFKTMERKLYRGIMMPSMIATLVLGIWLLALVPSFMSMGWMHLKLTMVVLLVGSNASKMRCLALLTGSKVEFWSLLGILSSDLDENRWKLFLQRLPELFKPSRTFKNLRNPTI